MTGLILLLASLSVGQVTDARYPAPSPDGTLLVFSWRGDLWQTDIEAIGEIRCLTPGTGYESHPVWSPNGEWIAFTSDRTGDGDVYVMPSSGGPAERLTYNSSYDGVTEWSAGSDSVYFISSRNIADNWVFSVAITGGTPRMIIPVMTDNLCRSLDGFLLERGHTPWWRRHYRGSASRDLWFGSGESWELVLGSEIDEGWPMCAGPGNVLLFVMEDGQGNAALWTLESGSEPCQRTFLRGDITWPRASQDGSTIAFEHGGDICTTSSDDWQVNRLEVDVTVDLPFPLDVQGIAGSITSEYDVSSDGTQIALVSMGEIYVGRIDENRIEDVKRVTSTTAAEDTPRWSPDGSMLVFSRESGGNIDLIVAQPLRTVEEGFWESHGFSEWVLPVEAEVAAYPVWSPLGDRISYLDGDRRLHVISFTGGRDILLCGTADILHHSWSPDAEWLAYSVPVLAHREEIYIVGSRGGEPVNVSMHPNDDFQPIWTPDGRRLVYASRTDEGDYFIKQIWFSQTDYDSDEEHREDLIDEPAEVIIDWNGLQRRTETLCSVEGYYDFFASDSAGKTFVFPAYDSDRDMDVWSVDWKGESLTRLTWSDDSPSRLSIPHGDTVFYLAYGITLRSISTSGGSSKLYGWSSSYEYNVSEMQYCKFDQAWRLLRDGFYDAGMHGVDWDEVRATYRDRAGAAIVNADFNDVVRRMLGELSASHLGVYGPGNYIPTAWTGDIGIVPDPDWHGTGIRVDSVIPRSPAGLSDSRLFNDDRILTVNGIRVGPENNFYRPFAQTSGHEVLLEVRRGGELVEVLIEPVSSWAIWQLLYDEWIARNRRTVDDFSDDRIGYLHIRSMSSSAVDVFNRDLFAEGLDREGLIIDVRGNGGGSTHDQILRMLDRDIYAYSHDRWGSPSFQPLGVWQKPLVLLINETCYSDAEIFPSGWKALELGPVVGAPTYGAVIGTVDVDLMDGTGFRIPSTGWYTLVGGNLENNGVTPDIYVVELPADQALGVDRQLEKALEIILSEIGG